MLQTVLTESWELNEENMQKLFKREGWETWRLSIETVHLYRERVQNIWK